MKNGDMMHSQSATLPQLGFSWVLKLQHRLLFNDYYYFHHVFKDLAAPSAATHVITFLLLILLNSLL